MAGLLLLVVNALGSAAASAAPLPPTITLSTVCGAGVTCTSFRISIVNVDSATIDGITVQQISGAITSFQLSGYPAGSCRPTGVQHAIGCLSIALAKDATVMGNGVSATPISSPTSFLVYTSTDHFATSDGQTVSLGSGTPPVPSLPPIGATTTSTRPVGGGLLVGLGAGVLVVGGLGFLLLAWARRKQRPSECAEQRTALAMAENALKYWDDALLHLRDVDPARAVLDATGNVAAPHHHRPNEMNATESATSLMKAQVGRDAAAKYRDQCQMDLIRCTASGGSTLAPMLVPQVVPVLTPSEPGHDVGGPRTETS